MNPFVISSDRRTTRGKWNSFVAFVPPNQESIIDATWRETTRTRYICTFHARKHGIQRNVAHQHHLVVVRLERDDEVTGRVLVQSAEHLGVHLGDAARRAQQTVAVGILADRDQDLAHGLLDRARSTPSDGSLEPSQGLDSIGPSYSATNGRLRYRSSTSRP